MVPREVLGVLGEFYFPRLHFGIPKPGPIGAAPGLARIHGLVFPVRLARAVRVLGPLLLGHRKGTIAHLEDGVLAEDPAVVQAKRFVILPILFPCRGFGPDAVPIGLKSFVVVIRQVEAVIMAELRGDLRVVEFRGIFFRLGARHLVRPVGLEARPLAADEEPQLVAHDRAAQGHGQFFVGIEPVCPSIIRRVLLQAFGVLTDPVGVLVMKGRRSVELVGARLGDDVEGRPQHLAVLGGGACAEHLVLGDQLFVERPREIAGSRRGPVDAVDVPLARLRVSAEGVDEFISLRWLGNAGGCSHKVVEVPPGRQVDDLIEIQPGIEGGARRVDKRCLGDHHDLVGEGLRHGEVDRRHRADRDPHVLGRLSLEAAEAGLHPEGADRDRREIEATR